MAERKDLISHRRYGWHKGFYNDEDFVKTVRSIEYGDFFDYPQDEEFPYDSAEYLLKGSCNHFVLGLKNVLGYTPYIIQAIIRFASMRFVRFSRTGNGIILMRGESLRALMKHFLLLRP